ncbi:MAG TPA: PAS domain S-box protein [Sphingomicrobium sp.]|jgi:PAS domain S-box-containing protein
MSRHLPNSFPLLCLAVGLPVFTGAAFLASAMLGLALSRGTGGIAALWLANAILLSALILAKPSDRWRHALACTVAGFAANSWGGTGLTLSAVFAAANLVSAVLAYRIICFNGGANRSFDTVASLGWFVSSIIPAVAIGASIAAIALWIATGSFLAAWFSWAASDLLGLLLVTPFVLTVANQAAALRDQGRMATLTSILWPLLALCVTTIAVFAQSQFPLLFLPLAVLLLLTYRLGLLGAVAGTMIVAVIGSIFLALGHGPIALIKADTGIRIQFFQFYLVTLYGTCLPLAALLNERARLARERSESERRHRRILDRSREVIFETDLDGRWTYLNPAWHTLTGHLSEESIGRSFLSVVAKEDRGAALERLAPLYAREIDECRQDLRFVHADGRTLWASVRSHLLTEENGVTIGTYGTLHDVSARVAAQAAQSESERLYRLLADNSNDMIVRFTLNGIRKYVSPASVAVLGFAPEELLNQPASGAIHPEDRASVIATCGTLLDGAPNPICSYRQLHKNGSYVWLEASYRLIRNELTGEPREFIASVRDVSRRTAAELERTRSAAELEEANRLLLMAEGMSGFGHWRVDTASGTAYWSDTVCAIHGHPPGYVPAMETAINAYHPDDRERVQMIVAKASATGEPFEFEARVVRPDGSTRLVQSEGRAEVGPHGVVTGLFGVFQDVTEAREAESALLRASEDVAASNRMLTMAEAVAHLGHWRVDSIAGTHFWSDEVFRIHGLSRDFVPTFANSLETYHAEDRARIAALVQTALSDGSNYSFRARVIRSEGDLVHVFVRGEVDRDAAGDVTGLFGIIQDVSEEARAEELLRDREARFRLITEQASDMIAIQDMTGSCVFMSPAARSVLGYDPDALLGSRAHDYAPPEDHVALDEFGARIMQDGTGAAQTLRFRMRHAEGSYRWMEAAAKLADYDGRPCFIAVVRDVTGQVSAERALNEARVDAEAAVRAKSSFLANMSHEIRTPMNAVVGFTELLLASELDGDQRRQTELIADSSRAMMRLLNDILDLSKVEAGQMKINREPFDLAHALKASLKLVAPAAEQKGVQLRCDLAPDLPTTLMGDGLRLRQIVLNLLGNAAKFTSCGSITLRASVQDDSLLAIEVEDTGIGIAADRQAAIFEQFVQSDSGIAARFGGTGLGLAISSQLTHLMGGELALASELGRGTRFTLTLPLGDMMTDEKPAPRLPSRQMASAPNGIARILVAEDHDVNQLLITAMLGKLGFVPEMAADGAEAVRLVLESAASNVPYSLVFMDMQMPEIDGLEASRRIRAEGFDAAALPIIALTANAYADDVEACQSAGMQAHIAKPFTLENLEAALRRWLPAVATAKPRGAARFSEKIQERYAARKQETLDRLAALVCAGTFEDSELDEVATMLHKLAGTAEMFGDVALGIEARLLENGIENWDGASRADRIHSAVEAIQLAA